MLAFRMPVFNLPTNVVVWLSANLRWLQIMWDTPTSLLSSHNDRLPGKRGSFRGGEGVHIVGLISDEESPNQRLLADRC